MFLLFLVSLTESFKIIERGNTCGHLKQFTVQSYYGLVFYVNLPAKDQKKRKTKIMWTQVGFCACDVKAVLIIMFIT